jgi:hypothetical protein
MSSEGSTLPDAVAVCDDEAGSDASGGGLNALGVDGPGSSGSAAAILL